MSNRDLLKEAIADAKAVKEIAITNAKAALEEAFTPHLMSMFEKKLAEMEGDEDEHMEEAKMHDEKEMKEEMHDDETMEEDLELEALLRELEEAEEEESEEEESEEGEEEEEESEEDIELDFDAMEKDPEKFTEMIEKIVDEVIDEMIADGELEAGHEGMEDEAGAGMEMPAEEPAEEAPVEEALRQGVYDDFNKWKNSFKNGTKFKEENGYMIARSHDGEELGKWNPTMMQGMHADDFSYKSLEEMKKMEDELKEAYAALEAVKGELNEVNLLNSKLLYVNKIFKAKNLTEAQKVHVLAAFDKAETVKESKLIYETLKENLSKPTATAAKKQFVTESKSFASKSVGTAPKQPVVETDPMVERFKKLAGLK